MLRQAKAYGTGYVLRTRLECSRYVYQRKTDACWTHDVIPPHLSISDLRSGSNDSNPEHKIGGIRNQVCQKESSRKANGVRLNKPQSQPSHEAQDRQGTVPLVRPLKVVAAGMTALGSATTLVAVPGPVAEIAAIHNTVDVLSLVIAFGWVLLIVTATVSVAMTSRRALGRAS
jgi:hypothetical protein